MRTIKEVMNKHADNWGSTFSSDWNDSNVKAAIKEYALAVVDEIINGDYVTVEHDGGHYVEWNDIKREQLIEQIENQ